MRKKKSLSKISKKELLLVKLDKVSKDKENSNQQRLNLWLLGI